MTGHSPVSLAAKAKTSALCANIGRRIRSARKQKGLTQDALAEAAGVSTKHLSSVENGKEPNLSIGYLMTICLVLGVEFGDLLYEDGRSSCCKSPN